MPRAGPLWRSPADAEKQLRSFVAKFEPKHQTLIRAVRKALRKRLPAAYELAYDNYNFFVLGYGPTDRPSECIISMAAGANGVGLCFVRGASRRFLCQGRLILVIRPPGPTAHPARGEANRATRHVPLAANAPLRSKSHGARFRSGTI